MEIIIKKDKIKTVAKRWKEQYYSEGRWTSLAKSFNETSKQIYEKLLKAKTEKEIIEIIGNSSWTENICDECNNDFDKLIMFIAYEETIKVCKDCLKKAIAKLS